MILTSNFQEWKNVLRHDLKRKTWSRDPITTVVLRVWKFEKLTGNVFLFSLTKWNAQNNVAIGKWGRPTVGFNKLTTGRVANWRRANQSPCWTQCMCSVELIKRKTPPWVVLIWPTLHGDGSFGGGGGGAIINTESTSLVSFSFSFPSWGVIVEKMLFEDCPVCHDPLSAKKSSSRESSPLPWRSRQACARWARAFAGLKFEPWQVDRIPRCIPTPFGGIEEDNKHGPVAVWLSTSSLLSLSLFVSFVESLCEIELHVGQGTRTFIFCLLHVD